MLNNTHRTPLRYNISDFFSSLLDIHSVITGGQSLNDTLGGFEQLAETTWEKNIVVWLNEYFGPTATAFGARSAWQLRESKSICQSVRI